MDFFAILLQAREPCSRLCATIGCDDGIQRCRCLDSMSDIDTNSPEGQMTAEELFEDDLAEVPQGTLVATPPVVQAQLVAHKEQKEKVPHLSVDVFKQRHYESDDQTMYRVLEVCKSHFSTDKTTRAEHIAAAKEYINEHFPDDEELVQKAEMLSAEGTSYDASTLVVEKNVLGGCNYTTRVFCHMMKVFCMLVCLDKAAENYGNSRKRKLEETLEDDYTEEDVTVLANFWKEKQKNKIIEVGMKGIMTAHIAHANGNSHSKDMTFICAIMIMTQGLFRADEPKYDIKSVLNLAISYERLCNWLTDRDSMRNRMKRFIPEEDRAAFERIQHNLANDPLVPAHLRNEYKTYADLRDSDDPDSEKDASERVTRIRKLMLFRWNAFTAQYGVPPRTYEKEKKKASASSAPLALGMQP